MHIHVKQVFLTNSQPALTREIKLLPQSALIATYAAAPVGVLVTTKERQYICFENKSNTRKRYVRAKSCLIQNQITNGHSNMMSS